MDARQILSRRDLCADFLLVWVSEAGKSCPKASEARRCFR